MRILILGGTGRTGRILLNEALKRGHQVSVVVSHEYRLKTDTSLIEIHEGTPLNKYTVSEAMKGCDAVLSTLSISRTSDFPWAELRTSEDFLSLSMINILDAAAEQHVNRIIITTAWGTSDTWRDLPFWFRWMVAYSNIYYAYYDHERQEEMLQKSNTSWTVVRPTVLTDPKKEKGNEIKVSLNNTPKPSLAISRLNVARFMLDVMENNLYIKQMPVISEK